MRILLIEDDELLPVGLQDAFAQAGFEMAGMRGSHPNLSR
jgi:DNA-binding response OmpR family regulator